MKYFINLCQKAFKLLLIQTILIAVLWGILYHITDYSTILKYFWTGVSVCVLNTLVFNIRKRKIETLFRVKSSWVIMAGVVLVFYHAGFEAAAVFTAAAIFASPFFWATTDEAIVGLSLLANLWVLIQTSI